MDRIKPSHDIPKRFGGRLAMLRKMAGYSQRDFAVEIGISQRMVAYYEKDTDRPPATLLPTIAKVLGVSTDELLGVKPLGKRLQRTRSRLFRRLSKVEDLPPKERRQVVQIIDTFLERAKLKGQQSI